MKLICPFGCKREATRKVVWPTGYTFDENDMPIRAERVYCEQHAEMVAQAAKLTETTVRVEPFSYPLAAANEEVS